MSLAEEISSVFDQLNDRGPFKGAYKKMIDDLLVRVAALEDIAIRIGKYRELYEAILQTPEFQRFKEYRENL